MKSLRIILVALGIVAGGAAALVLAGPWTDTQTASGTVTAESESVLLYICDTDGGSEPPEVPWGCNGDDSGPDEIIFHGDEDLEPAGAAATWLFVLANISTGAWDVTGATFTVTQTVDPDGGCTVLPDVLLHRSDMFGGEHVPGEEPIPGSQAFPDENGANPRIVHTGVNGSYWMGIRVSLAASTPAECMGSAWDIVTNWTVQPHD